MKSIAAGPLRPLGPQSQYQPSTSLSPPLSAPSRGDDLRFVSPNQKYDERVKDRSLQCGFAFCRGSWGGSFTHKNPLKFAAKLLRKDSLQISAEALSWENLRSDFLLEMGCDLSALTLRFHSLAVTIPSAIQMSFSLQKVLTLPLAVQKSLALENPGRWVVRTPKGCAKKEAGGAKPHEETPHRKQFPTSVRFAPPPPPHSISPSKSLRNAQNFPQLTSPETIFPGSPKNVFQGAILARFCFSVRPAPPPFNYAGRVVKMWGCACENVRVCHCA